MMTSFVAGQPGGTLAPSLDRFPDKFDVAKGSSPAGPFGLDFVYREEFTQVYNVAKRTIEAFARNPFQGTEFPYVVVDGASGSGKTRLCWEVGRALVEHHGAQHLFVNCNTVSLGSSSTDAERAAEFFRQRLAKELVRGFTPGCVFTDYVYNLDQVLARIKKDTGSTLVVLQLDEYITDQALARALIRACYSTFVRGSQQGQNVLVMPLLSGNCSYNFRQSLIQVSQRPLPTFVSLAGITDIAGLETRVQQ
jgi:hypothetical protein